MAEWTFSSGSLLGFRLVGEVLIGLYNGLDWFVTGVGLTKGSDWFLEAVALVCAV